MLEKIVGFKKRLTTLLAKDFSGSVLIAALYKDESDVDQKFFVSGFVPTNAPLDDELHDEMSLIVSRCSLITDRGSQRGEFYVVSRNFQHAKGRFVLVAKLDRGVTEQAKKRIRSTEFLKNLESLLEEYSQRIFKQNT